MIPEQIWDFIFLIIPIGAVGAIVFVAQTNGRKKKFIKREKR